MYRDLMPRLADRWHVVAPTCPASDFPPPRRDVFAYSFEAITQLIERFTETLGLSRFAVMVFDYGAPVGFRLALRHPERITAIITQNGNAYEEGLSEGFNPIQAYWQAPSAANRDALRGFLAPETTRWQYAHGVHDESLLAPEAWTLDQALLDRPGIAEIQLDLFLDYQSNVALYPRSALPARPSATAAGRLGRNDRFFLPAGAEALRRDIPEAEVHLLDAGHFALETRGVEIAALVRAFLSRVTAP